MGLIFGEREYQTLTYLTSETVTDGFAIVSCGIRSSVPQDAAGAAEQFALALVAADVDDALNQAFTLDRVEAFNEETTGLSTIGNVGSGTGDLLPPNCAVNVRKRTIRRGPRGRGRWQWPGMLGETSVDEAGNLGTSTVNFLQDLFDELYATLAANDLVPVILQGDEGRSEAISPSPTVTRFVVDSKVSTQRHRLRR